MHSIRDGNMKRDVAADILTFMGFKGEWDSSSDEAIKHGLHLIYDSSDFEPSHSFEFLQSLKDVDSRIYTSTSSNHDEF